MTNKNILSVGDSVFYNNEICVVTKMLDTHVWIYKKENPNCTILTTYDKIEVPV